jgi:Raf kinase inhibitor-like YbhB/YbcL family protein
MMTFTMYSPAFSYNGPIPNRYTHIDGEDISPPLAWENTPPGTQSLALIVEDPDAPDPAAPKMIFVHWILYNIPPTINSLPEGYMPSPGVIVAKNDSGKTAYTGPYPPIGRHRYFFHLYALNTILPELADLTRDKLLATIKPHLLAQATTMGTYKKIGTP